MSFKESVRLVIHNFHHKLTSDEKKLVLFVCTLGSLIFVGLVCNILG